jgi:hypothetical protein
MRKVKASMLRPVAMVSLLGTKNGSAVGGALKR